MSRSVEGIKYELARAGFNPVGMSRKLLRALAKQNRKMKRKAKP